MAEIDAQLNFVFPIRSVEREDPTDPQKTISEPVLWAYHTPISQEVFRANYRVFAATKYALFREGADYARTIGITVADLELADAAAKDAAERGTMNAGPALKAEFRRTLILAPGPNGYELLTAESALQNSVITRDEWHDAECVIVFFTCFCAVALRAKRSLMEEAVSLVMKGSMTSLPPLEWVASLQPSTPAETSAPATPSLPPS